MTKMEGQLFTLTELAQETGSQLIGDGEYVIGGVAELKCATPNDAVYVAENKFIEALQQTKAGVIFITPQMDRPEGRNYLLSNDPALAFQKLSKLIARVRRKPSGFSGVHPSAVIHPSARLAPDVTVGPNTVIDRDVVIGAGTTIGPLVFLGPDVTIGVETHIAANVTIQERCQIGNRVVILSGTVIGSIGFGFRQDEDGKHHRYEHLGNVVISDDVEIGANTTIDRARLKSTKIGRGTKIDNQVQIAHNCDIGEDNIIIAQVGIAGSAETGRWVILAGRAAINDHVKLCDKTVIAACSAVLKSITTPGTYIGFPAVPLRRHHRILVCFHHLDRIYADVQKMKKLLNMPADPSRRIERE